VPFIMIDNIIFNFRIYFFAIVIACFNYLRQFNVHLSYILHLLSVPLDIVFHPSYNRHKGGIIAMDFDSLSLSDFDIVASDAIPAITLDRQRRFYINVSARRLLGINPYQRMSVAYSPDKRLLAVIRPNVDATPAERAALTTSSYNVTARYYMSARLFAREYGF